MRNLKSITLIFTTAIMLAACSSPVKLENKPAVVEDRSNTTNPADTRAVNPIDTSSTDALNDPQSILSKRSIYFEFDSYIIKDEFKSVIEAHAQYLNSHKTRKITIQGNTDERGGREYNVALGQKRAEAVRKSLVLLGVSESQMEAISFGKEKPKALGSDEASYAENRRSDLVYQ